MNSAVTFTSKNRLGPLRR